MFIQTGCLSTLGNECSPDETTQPQNAKNVLIGQRRRPAVGIPSFAAINKRGFCKKENQKKRQRNNALCVQQQQQCMSTTRKNRSRRDVSGIRYSVRAVGDKCLLLLILFSHTFLAYSERVLYSFLFVLGAHKREALINFLLRLPVKNERGTFFPLARAPRVVSARVSETHSWSLEGWEAQA